MTGIELKRRATRSIVVSALAVLITWPVVVASSADGVPLQPGPHSAIADVDLPAGTVPVPRADSDGEYWHYTAPYPDTVTFLQKNCAIGAPSLEPQVDSRDGESILPISLGFSSLWRSTSGVADLAVSRKSGDLS